MVVDAGEVKRQEHLEYSENGTTQDETRIDDKEEDDGKAENDDEGGRQRSIKDAQTNVHPVAGRPVRLAVAVEYPAGTLLCGPRASRRRHPPCE